MSIEPFVTALNGVYLLLMGVISVVGTATLIKLMIELLHTENRVSGASELEVEDA